MIHLFSEIEFKQNYKLCKKALKLCGLNSGDLHRYHTKIDEFLERCLIEMNKQLVGKLLSVLDGLLKKLSRYDEGTFFSSILSLTVIKLFSKLSP